MILPVLTEAVRLRYLQAMCIPVWKLRKERFASPCYSVGLTFKGQVTGQIIAPVVVDCERCDQILLKNIMTALNLTLTADLSIAQAPSLTKLADTVQLVLIFGRELGDFYQHEEHWPINFGELVSVNRLVISCTYSLADMLAQPLLKREVWQHLQAVLKYLDTYAN